MPERVAVEERFLVTGAFGCLGAWVCAQLANEGVPVIGLDRATDPYRLRYLVDDPLLARIRLVERDVLDLPFLIDLVRRERISSIIHLAALQVPFARADPFLAAQVNVGGTLAVLEAARACDTVTDPLVYASSIAAYGAPDGDHPDAGISAELSGFPRTHYGVYKRANEDSARVHWLEFGCASIGLRPHVLYGVGRDQGLTSAPTRAMLAAAVGRRETIPFTGSVQLQHAADVAAAFIAAARSGYQGSAVFNLGGPATSMGDLVATIEATTPEATGLITVQGGPLPFPAAVDPGGLEAVIGQIPRTPLDQGVVDTIERFRRLHREGWLA